MKKLSYLIVLTLILGLVLTGCLLSNVGQVPATEQSGITYLTKGTETDPDEFPLYAGQDIPVGTVYVWNDGTNLTITYDTTDSDWVMTETHLAVVDKFDDFPMTKKGNPIPGQFPYQCCYDETEGEWLFVKKPDTLAGTCDADGKEDATMTAITYTIPLDWGPNTQLYIAAHAVVQKCETESFTFNPELTWTRSSESNVAVFPGYGAQWTQEEGFNILPDPLAEVWDGGTPGQYFTGYSIRDDISWASWICTQNQSGKSLTGTDLRRFNATFDIPVGYTVTGGTLGSVNSGYGDVIPMNDNIYIFVNEELIFWGGTISLDQLDPTRTHFLGMERRPTQPQDQIAFPETDGWHMDGTIPAISSSLFIEGANNLDVFAEELWTGGGMHELGLTLQVEQTTCETETAWAGTEEGKIQFPGANWATYFDYIVTEGVLEVTQDSGQNDENRTLSRPHINWTIDGLCIEFEFVNPTTHAFVFDYRVDGEAGEMHEYSNIVITGGELLGELIGLRYNWVVIVGVGTKTVTVCAEEEVWVGMRVGAEHDWYLDWIIFEAKW